MKIPRDVWHNPLIILTDNWYIKNDQWPNKCWLWSYKWLDSYLALYFPECYNFLHKGIIPPVTEEIKSEKKDKKQKVKPKKPKVKSEKAIKLEEKYKTIQDMYNQWISQKQIAYSIWLSYPRISAIIKKYVPKESNWQSQEEHQA